MIGLEITVPIASWRKAHARELLETHLIPPPATCYGALLSLVGEEDRDRHRGARVTAGVFNEPLVSTVLRTLWRIKDRKTSQGNGENARPDFQQLVVQAELMIWCDSSDEGAHPTLEERVRAAMTAPGETSRFGGWSLGESTHLINDAWLVPEGVPRRACRAFVTSEAGNLTLPAWVDHVGMSGTRYVVGELRVLDAAPMREDVPQIGPR